MFITRIKAENIRRGDILRLEKNSGIASQNYKGDFRRPLAIIRHRGKVCLPIVDNHKITLVSFKKEDAIMVKRPKYNATRAKSKAPKPVKPVPPVGLVQTTFFDLKEQDAVLGY